MLHLPRAIATACLAVLPLVPGMAFAQAPNPQALPAGFSLDFTGTYGSQTMLADGFTHTEKANVSDGRVELEHEFVSRDGRSRGSFRWTGTYAVTGGSVAAVSGQGMIDNIGQRTFSVTDASLRFDASGIPQLCWRATDPKFGPIGGCSQRQSAIVNAPVSFPPAPSTAQTMPVPAPAPAPIAIAPAPVLLPVPTPAPIAIPPAPVPLPSPVPAPPTVTILPAPMPAPPPVALVPAPTPVPVPPVTPAPSPVAIDYTGTYRSQTTLADGYTHTETAVVTATTASLIHQFVSRDGKNGGNFRWNGAVVRAANGTGTVTGQGVIDNLGQRNFVLGEARLSRDGNGMLSLCWKATDPKFGPIGGCSQRLSTAITSLPAPLVFSAPSPSPVPIPAPTPIAMPAPAPVPVPVASNFTGTYRSQTTLADGYTHTETAVVNGTAASLIHQFVSRDGRNGGNFRWNGTLSWVADGSAVVNGQGIIDNLGQRNFALGEANVRVSGNIATLCWKATDPKFGGIGGCSQRQSTAVSALPQPILFAPTQLPAPAATNFTGTYRSQTTLADGYTHTETAVVMGSTVSLIHQFVSRDGKSGGNFRWGGTLAIAADGSATVTGQGVIDNLGQRNFGLGETTIRVAGNVITLCWKATDPKFGAIGGCSQRQNTVVTSLPAPLKFGAGAPTPVPTPAPGPPSGSGPGSGAGNGPSSVPNEPSDQGQPEALAFCWQNKSNKWFCDGKLQILLTSWDTEKQALNMVHCKSPTRLNGGKQVTLHSTYSTVKGQITGWLYGCGERLKHTGSQTDNRDIRRFWGGITW